MISATLLCLTAWSRHLESTTVSIIIELAVKLFLEMDVMVEKFQEFSLGMTWILSAL